MSDNFLGPLKLEIERLRNALSSDRRFIRLQHLESVLKLYEEEDGQQVSKSSFKEERSNQPGRPPSPIRDIIIRESARFLYKNEPNPTTTRDILLHLSERGLVIEGANPVNSLSAMLSASRNFVSHGRPGWTLTSSHLRQFAGEFTADVPLGVLRDGLSDWDSRRHLEPNLDGVLLAKAREKLGRDLDEDERINLREAFVELARQKLG